MEQYLHMALITQDPARVDAVAGVTEPIGWRLESSIGQPQIITWLRRIQPGAVVVDLDVPNAIPLVREIAGTLPKATILVLVAPQHLVELQDALMAGAASFVAFPVDAQQFITTVVRSVQNTTPRAATSTRGRMVVVSGLKGGVGRTTLAVNLAVALRQQVGKDVVLVEAHHGLSDLSLMLNLSPRHTLASLAQEENIDADVIRGHLHDHVSGLKVLAAPQDVAALVNLPIETWRHILTILLDVVPYVVVDTSSVGDDVLAEVLSMADDILIVTGPDLAGMRSAVVLLQGLVGESIQARTHVVLNRAGVRGGVSEAACAKQIGESIAAAVPDDAALATFALNRGVPFVLSHPRTILSRKVQELAINVFGLKSADVSRWTDRRFSFGVGKTRTVQQVIAG